MSAKNASFNRAGTETVSRGNKYLDEAVAVFVPAYNEEKLIGKVLEVVPSFIDHIIVVDDASSDRTGEVVKAHQEEDCRIIYLRHPRDEGVGGAIVSGYKWAL